MLALIRDRLTYANVMATIAVFVALGAGAYAAGLAPNSVKSKHIVNGHVKRADLSARALAGSEDWHDAGFDGLSSFCDWTNFGSGFNDAGYFRDRAGVVHLRGLVRVNDGAEPCNFAFDHEAHIFSLSPGYQPEHDEVLATISNNAPARINVRHEGFNNGMGSVEVELGFPTAANAKQWVSLDGLSFRCGPSGVDGCP